MSQFCLLDSNVRHPYFSRPDVTNLIRSELAQLKVLGRINKLKYLAPPFMIYEMLGMGKLNIQAPNDEKLATSLDRTVPGSKAELDAMNDLFNDLFCKYRNQLEYNKRFSVNSLRRKFKLQKSYIHIQNRREFDLIFAAKISRSFNRELVKDFLAFELMISHEYKGFDLERMARFFMVSVAHFLKGDRENSFYRAMVRIWKDSYRNTIVRERENKGLFQYFTNEAILEIERGIKLGKGEDFLDSEGIQYLLLGNIFKGVRSEVIMLTADPRGSFLLRVGFFKSFHSLIDQLIKKIGGSLPPLMEGLVGFVDLDGKNINWVETKDVPPLLHYMDFNSLDSYRNVILAL